jgi:hypothetical protein
MMNLIYPVTAMVGGMMLLVWRYLLHRRPQPVRVVDESEDDYGTPVAPTG